MDKRFEALYPEKSWETEIAKIISLAKSGDSAQVIGFPGVGRSNLLGLLAYNRNTRIHHLENEQKKFHFVLMNFSEARNMDLSEIFKFFFVSIIDSLSERRMSADSEKVKTIFADSLKASDQQLLLHGLKKTIDFLCLEKNLTIIFLFDRFDEYAASATTEFFTVLRALRNRAKYRFSAVFSMERPLEETLDKEVYKDFYEFLEGNQIYLPLTDSESLQFRTSYIEKNKGKKLPKEVLDRILDLTGGHGKLARFCADSYLSSDQTPSSLEEFFLENSKVKATLLDIWKYLTPEEQKIVSTSNYSLLTSDLLEKVGMVKNGKITIPLLEQFIKSNREELEKVSEGKIIFDPEQNEIKKGEVVLSDILTSSEFKLLKYLIANEGKIVSRDDIVGSVWGELSSTAGVTEQALDQLIFRLRKKIEDNPNSPTHILTVKGRGFKFIS